jgi:hypothetical protein
MPPRYAFWTILIDNAPTAFRAREQADLVPTLVQLRRTNPSVEMRWFARGRLWASPDEERAARRRPPQKAPRGRDWRPGGAHKDARARFHEQKRRDRQAKRKRSFERRERERNAGAPRVQPGGRPPSGKPLRTRPQTRRPQTAKPSGRHPHKPKPGTPPRRAPVEPAEVPLADQHATRPEPPERG